LVCGSETSERRDVRRSGGLDRGSCAAMWVSPHIYKAIYLQSLL